MKFASDLDAQLFLMEIGQFDMEVNKELEPTNEQITAFISKRKPLESLIKNHRKSQVQKGNWRKNRTKMMRGIKAFHKSTEGKRFHRNLGNFLATRFTNNDTGRTSLTRTNEDFEYLKALNSAKTHLYIELEYYHQIYEQIELEEFALDYAYDMFRSIEKKILNDSKLNENEIQFLFDITETASVVKAFAEKSGKTVDEVETMWKAIKDSLIEQGKDEEDENFYPILVGALKKQLGL